MSHPQILEFSTTKTPIKWLKRPWDFNQINKVFLTKT